MIDDGLVAIRHPHSVERLTGEIAWTDTQIANDDIVSCVQPQVVFANADALARCGLSSDRQKRVLDD